MMNFVYRFAATAALILLVSACAQGARTNAMVAPVQPTTILPENSPLKSSSTVTAVTGGQETNPLWVSDISNASFKTALEQSLALHTILADGTGPLSISANLVSVDKPLVGISFTVTTVVAYTVTDAVGTTVYSETVTTPYTAEFSDAFLGVERLRLANEGSAKANIAKFIDNLVAAAQADPAGFARPKTS